MLFACKACFARNYALERIRDACFFPHFHKRRCWSISIFSNIFKIYYYNIFLQTVFVGLSVILLKQAKYDFGNKCVLYSAISKSNFIGIFVSYCTVTTFCFYDFDALFLTFDFSCVAPKCSSSHNNLSLLRSSYYTSVRHALFDIL